MRSCAAVLPSQLCKPSRGRSERADRPLPIWRHRPRGRGGHRGFIMLAIDARGGESSRNGRRRSGPHLDDSAESHERCRWCFRAAGRHRPQGRGAGEEVLRQSGRSRARGSVAGGARERETSPPRSPRARRPTPRRRPRIRRPPGPRCRKSPRRQSWMSGRPRTPSMRNRACTRQPPESLHARRHRPQGRERRAGRARAGAQPVQLAQKHLDNLRGFAGAEAVKSAQAQRDAAKGRYESAQAQACTRIVEPDRRRRDRSPALRGRDARERRPSDHGDDGGSGDRPRAHPAG